MVVMLGAPRVIKAVPGAVLGLVPAWRCTSAWRCSIRRC
jgi:hypothetical protein